MVQSLRFNISTGIPTSQSTPIEASIIIATLRNIDGVEIGRNANERASKVLFFMSPCVTTQGLISMWRQEMGEHEGSMPATVSRGRDLWCYAFRYGEYQNVYKSSRENFSE